LEPVDPGRRDAAQPTELRRRRRAAALGACGGISGGVGAGPDDKLAGDGGFLAGGVGEPTTDEWRFTMNRKGLVLSFAAFLISGALFAGVGFRVVSHL